MSEATETYNVETTTVEATETKRQTLSLQDRFKVIDWLRVRVEPIIAATKIEAAAIVSEACGVTVTASQLWYMVDELPDYGLGAKFAIDVLTEPQEIMRRDIEQLKTCYELLMAQNVAVANAFVEVLDRVKAIEAEISQAIAKAKDASLPTLLNSCGAMCDSNEVTVR